MKTFLIIFAAAVGLVNAASISSIRDINSWEEFKLKYDKVYTSEIEEEFRHKIFVDNLNKISKHNEKYAKGLITFKIGVNQFSDLLHHEFTENRFGIQTPESFRRPAFELFDQNVTALPGSFDWREKGAITEVKQQAHCGACWAFSAIGAVETQQFLKTGELVSLSEQNIIDCAQGGGCSGGAPYNALKYIIDNGGVDTEDSYPYKARVNQRCLYNPKSSGASVSRIGGVPFADEGKLKEVVAALGSVAVAIDASGEAFQHYIGGVYFNENCVATHPNHGVLVVGYGTDENGVDFWTVKNSWSQHWGEDGYMRITRNRNNHCGVASYGVVPIA